MRSCCCCCPPVKTVKTASLWTLGGRGGGGVQMHASTPNGSHGHQFTRKFLWCFGWFCNSEFPGNWGMKPNPREQGGQYFCRIQNKKLAFFPRISKKRKGPQLRDSSVNQWKEKLETPLVRSHTLLKVQEALDHLKRAAAGEFVLQARRCCTAVCQRKKTPQA